MLMRTSYVCSQTFRQFANGPWRGNTFPGDDNIEGNSLDSGKIQTVPYSSTCHDLLNRLIISSFLKASYQL